MSSFVKRKLDECLYNSASSSGSRLIRAHAGLSLSDFHLAAAESIKLNLKHLHMVQTVKTQRHLLIQEAGHFTVLG